MCIYVHAQLFIQFAYYYKNVRFNLIEILCNIANYITKRIFTIKSRNSTQEMRIHFHNMYTIYIYVDRQK